MPPRYATARDLSRRTTGEGVAKIMRALGQPPMPWQTYTATVGGEVNECGLYVYPLVVVSVPRQAGKTAMMLAQAIHRCLQGPNRRAWFTAQTGQDARDKFRELVGLVMASPLRELVLGRPRLQNGAECLTFVNGSTMRPHPPTRDAVHGKQSDHNDVDEGWSFDEPAGAELFQAIAPTQATRPGAQTWVWSTMGDAASVWFHRLAERAQAGTEGLAGFVWGIPEDAAVDLETIVAHHPAVGHTQTRDTIRAGIATIGEDKPAEVARAYGNRATGGRERVIPTEDWDAARVEDELDDELAAASPAYGIAVWEPRDGGDVAGALVAAVAGPDGVPVVEVIAHRPGRAWLAEEVLGLRDRGQAIAVDRKGPAGPVADALELAGVQLLALDGTAVASASQDLRDRLCDEDARRRDEDGRTHPRVRHRSDPRLDAAVEVAGRRFIGEGAWVFSARKSTGDVACLQAATLAVRALDHAPAELVVGRSVFAA